MERGRENASFWMLEGAVCAGASGAETARLIVGCRRRVEEGAVRSCACRAEFTWNGWVGLRLRRWWCVVNGWLVSLGQSYKEK
jgi:hypothetical protein